MDGSDGFRILVSAFTGAFAAFSLNALREVMRERAKQHGAIVAAQYALGLQRNDLWNLTTQFFDKARTDPERHLKTPQILYSFTPLRVDPASLNFLVTAERGNEVTQVLLAQASFENTLLMLARYNESRIALEGVSKFQMPLGGQMARFIIADHDVIQLLKVQQNLDNLVQITDGAANKIDAAIETLAKTGKDHLMEKKFLKFGIRETAQVPEVSKVV